MSGLFSSGHNDEAVMHGEFMGFVLDDESLLSLRGWAERQGYPQATVQQGGPDMFAQLLESAAPPKMVIVDIDQQADPAAVTARIINLCGGECRLVVVGSKNDVTLYRKILGAGAVDYLVKPLTPDLLNQALAAALRGPAVSNKQVAKEARVVVFIGARGGIGTSTISLNTAWIMAHELDRNVALFDLDLHFGTSSLSLDLDPGHGLRDIVSSPNRVDALMIASSIVPESDNLSILGAEEAVDEVTPIDGAAIAALLKEMKSNFDVIVIDLPRHILASQKRLLASAHEVVVVSDLTLAGIRDTLRIKNALTAIGCSGHISTIGARVSPSGSGQVTRAIFEKGIKNPIDAAIPEDSASLTTASNSGKALGAIAPRAAITKVMRELALKLTNTSEQPTGKTPATFWNKIAGDVKGKVERRGKT
ncbi:MAG: AAA family ATPase [Bdellovibrionales bacterium]